MNSYENFKIFTGSTVPGHVCKWNMLNASVLKTWQTNNYVTFETCGSISLSYDKVRELSGNGLNFE